MGGCGPHNSGAPPVSQSAAPWSRCSRTFPPPPGTAPRACPALHPPGRPGEGTGGLHTLGIGRGGTGSPSLEGTQDRNRAGVQGQAENTSLKTVSWRLSLQRSDAPACRERGPCPRLLEGWTCWSPAPGPPDPRAHEGCALADSGVSTPGSPRGPPCPSPVSDCCSFRLCSVKGRCGHRGRSTCCRFPAVSLIGSHDSFRKGQTWAPGEAPRLTSVCSRLCRNARSEATEASGMSWRCAGLLVYPDSYESPNGSLQSLKNQKNNKTITAVIREGKSRAPCLWVSAAPPPTAAFPSLQPHSLQPLRFLSWAVVLSLISSSFNTQHHIVTWTPLVLAPCPPGLTPPLPL